MRGAVAIWGGKASAVFPVVKHAQARRAEVTATVGNGMLHVSGRDDGIAPIPAATERSG